MTSVDDFGHKSTKDAINDLLQFEQLQEQAERMKGLGNKHMADQVSTGHGHGHGYFRSCFVFVNH